jgi:hypothetical protein
LDRVNQQWEEPDHQWKAAAFMRWHEPYEGKPALLTEPEVRTKLSAAFGPSVLATWDASRDSMTLWL